MGLTDKVSGKVKQAAGDLTGDESKRQEGLLEERKGEAKDELSTADERAQRKADEVADLARSAVRGLSRSKRQSTIRLNAIAQVRAPTIATITNSSTITSGIPSAARKPPVKAKGMAKMVSLNLIISWIISSLEKGYWNRFDLPWKRSTYLSITTLA